MDSSLLDLDILNDQDVVYDLENAEEKNYKNIISYFQNIDYFSDFISRSDLFKDLQFIQIASLNSKYTEFILPREFSNLEKIQIVCFDSIRGINLSEQAEVLKKMKNLKVIKVRMCSLHDPSFVEGLYEIKGLTLIDFEHNKFLKSDQEKIKAELKKNNPGCETGFSVPFDEFDDFKYYGSELPEEGSAHIKAENLKLLYWHLPYDPLRTILYGNRHFDEFEDKTAALKAMQCAIGIIMSKYEKFKKFGRTDDEMVREYEDPFHERSIPYIFDLKENIKNKSLNLNSENTKSDVFNKYMQVFEKYQSRIARAATDFVAEIENDSSDD